MKTPLPDTTNASIYPRCLAGSVSALPIKTSGITGRKKSCFKKGRNPRPLLNLHLNDRVARPQMRGGGGGGRGGGGGGGGALH
ncbi:unnamed protein product [Pleuronectes platessa]|uniref:Uncharacterized protein n=1 Tax=Pleuronectes platessa TaxID=8262 RepID=A0A9N7YP92_PLEPL|nr:unnamed protein product [Pleuronectes platessa]